MAWFRGRLGERAISEVSCFLRRINIHVANDLVLIVQRGSACDGRSARFFFEGDVEGDLASTYHAHVDRPAA